MTAGVAAEPRAYVPIPAAGIAGREPLAFPVYLRTGADTWVLYRERHSVFGEDQVQRLVNEGVPDLYVAADDRGAYLQRIEKQLGDLMQDRQVAVERRADVLHGVACAVAGELLHEGLDRASIERAQRVLVSASGLVVREQRAFSVLRNLLGASEDLVQHSLTVSFLTMGLARRVLAADPSLLVMAGLAGMLHDVGRVGYEEVDHDPEHVVRGSRMLRGFGLPPEVCDAVELHHERWDGSGFPRALQGRQIPVLAQLVGIVDVFEKVYSAQQPRVGVFDALRILAQAYRGCFQPELARHLVLLFR